MYFKAQQTRLFNKAVQQELVAHEDNSERPFGLPIVTQLDPVATEHRARGHSTSCRWPYCWEYRDVGIGRHGRKIDK